VEGAQLAGSIYTWRKLDLIVSVERQHTRAHCGSRVSSSEHPGSRVLHFSGYSNKGRGCIELGRISPWILWQGSRGTCYVYRFLCIVLLGVSHALDTTYIYFHSKLVFPGGVLSRVMLTKNTCVHFMHA
jgi:hypothetical protein